LPPLARIAAITAAALERVLKSQYQNTFSETGNVKCREHALQMPRTTVYNFPNRHSMTLSRGSFAIAARLYLLILATG
jgi:hypothetical protein